MRHVWQIRHAEQQDALRQTQATITNAHRVAPLQGPSIELETHRTWQCCHFIHYKQRANPILTFPKLLKVVLPWGVDRGGTIPQPHPLSLGNALLLVNGQLIAGHELRFEKPSDES